MAANHKKSPCPCGERGAFVYCRGLCGVCYQRVYRLVREGTMTWKQAERRGLVRPASGERARCGDRRHVTTETLARPYAQ